MRTFFQASLLVFVWSFLPLPSAVADISPSLSSPSLQAFGTSAFLPSSFASKTQTRLIQGSKPSDLFGVLRQETPVSTGPQTVAETFYIATVVYIWPILAGLTLIGSIVSLFVPHRELRLAFGITGIILGTLPFIFAVYLGLMMVFILPPAAVLLGLSIAATVLGARMPLKRVSIAPQVTPDAQGRLTVGFGLQGEF